MPEVKMIAVIDPKCPHCVAALRALENERRLRVKAVQKMRERKAGPAVADLILIRRLVNDGILPSLPSTDTHSAKVAERADRLLDQIERMLDGEEDMELTQ